MRKTVTVVMLIAIALAGVGCDEKDMQRIDAAAETGVKASEIVEATLESPAGVFVPLDVRLWTELGFGLLGGAATVWLDWRNRRNLKVTKAIVNGIEYAEDDGARVKPEIQKAMIDEGVLKQGKALVQSLKG